MSLYAAVPPRFADARLSDRIACLLGIHQRLGRTISWDGRDFRTICRHCHAPLYKHGNVRWRSIRRRKDVLLLEYRPEALSAD